MNHIKYILFDAANTLIHKPDLWRNFSKVLLRYNYRIDVNELQLKHKLLSETIDFPDVTSKGFYDVFNTKVLNSLGIVENESILNAIFEACKYLPWIPFDDVKELSEIKNTSLGVLSNFNKDLSCLLLEKLPDIQFKDIIVSEEEKVAKPEIAFYQLAIEKIGLKPNEILYIGDSLRLDIIPALKVGLNVRLIDRHHYYKSSEYRMASLKELSLKFN